MEGIRNVSFVKVIFQILEVTVRTLLIGLAFNLLEVQWILISLAIVLLINTLLNIRSMGIYEIDKKSKVVVSLVYAIPSLVTYVVSRPAPNAQLIFYLK